MLVLPLAASAASVDSSAAILLCPADDACDAAAEFAATALAGEELVRLELLLERDNGGWAAGVDTRAAFADALGRAEVAAGKGRWSLVKSATVEARDRLASVFGDVNTQSLYTLWFLQGAAAVELGKEGAAYAFRQAAALSEGVEVRSPPHTEVSARVWADERRKLVVGGSGKLRLEGPEGVRWSVDGVPLGEGVGERTLLPGNHRIVATRAGGVRSWQGEAPVLAGRTVVVQATFDASSSAHWLQARLEEAFDTASGPPELTALLTEWAQRRQLSALRLVRVETTNVAALVAPRIGAGDPLRPAAADGEREDHGDGIPSTYAEEVVSRNEAVHDVRSGEERRLRVLWYDPALQRFSLDAGPMVQRAELSESRFRASLHVGYAGMMAHHHAAFDLGAAWRVGPVEVEGRLGLVRSDGPYNLYAKWVDQQLYHVSVGVRWAPSWRIAPFVSLAPEVYIPVAVGARVSAGVQFRVERRWLLLAEGYGGWLDKGAEGGGGVALAWTY